MLKKLVLLNTLIIIIIITCKTTFTFFFIRKNQSFSGAKSIVYLDVERKEVEAILEKLHDHIVTRDGECSLVTISILLINLPMSVVFSDTNSVFADGVTKMGQGRIPPQPSPHTHVT